MREWLLTVLALPIAGIAGVLLGMTHGAATGTAGGPFGAAPRAEPMPIDAMAAAAILAIARKAARGAGG